MLLTTCSLGLGKLRSSNLTARHHSQRQIKKAKHLFTEQGIIVPIVVDECSLDEPAGHFRCYCSLSLSAS